MSLFNRTSTQSSSTLSIPESVAGICLVAVCADGDLSTEEIDVLLSSLTRLKMFRSYSSDVMVRMLNRLISVIKRQGLNALLEMVLQSLPQDLYETSFAIAVDLVLADGEVTEEEEQLLEDLYIKLNIPEDLASQIITVLEIKNKG